MQVKKDQKMYRVVQELFIPANSPRHAARIAKGVQRIKEGGEEPVLYTVEPLEAYGTVYMVDLSKVEGEDEYCKQVK